MFIGNDYPPAFFKKGKILHIELMQKNEKIVDVYTNLGDFLLNTDTLDILEEFACHLYGHVKQNDVHEVIKLHYVEKNKLNCIERPSRNIKSVEPTTFLPFRSILTQHNKRDWYIAKLYRSASEAYPMNELTPIDYGWKLLDASNFLTFMWFKGQQVRKLFNFVCAFL